ncbi:MAG: hypothetical protein ACK58T_27295 [Phycisphaerae bacterium]
MLVVDSYVESDDASRQRQSDSTGNADGDLMTHNRLRYVMTTSTECQVSVGPEFLAALTDTVGESCIDLKAAKVRKPSSGSTGR